MGGRSPAAEPVLEFPMFSVVLHSNLSQVCIGIPCKSGSGVGGLSSSRESARWVQGGRVGACLVATTVPPRQKNTTQVAMTRVFSIM
eukprot:COSAG02_NODE_7900_length_2798_cov_21.351053_2_plen_87_part_00